MKIRCVYLAAGNSRRFGKNKLFHMVGQNPMYLHLLDRLAAVAERHKELEIVVVSQYEELLQEAPGLSAIPLWKRSGGPFLPAPAVCILYTAPRAGREYPTASGPGSWRECRNPARSLECAGRRPGESRMSMCFLWPTSRGFRKGLWKLFWNS